MKHTLFIVTLFIALLLYSCKGENENLLYEPGVYQPYKQDTISVHAFSEGRDMDPDLIRLQHGLASGKVGDIYYVDMAAGEETSGIASTKWNNIQLLKGNRAYIDCPTCLNTMHLATVVGDSLFITPQILNVVKFSPYSELGAVVVTDAGEAERHATLRAKMVESGFVVTTYDVSVRSSSFKRGVNDAYYLDQLFLQNELKNSDTLIYVKKETYFKKR